MPPPPDDPWSDSDDDLDDDPDLETTVQLGIPDGPIVLPTDLSDPSVSRIGGRPTFLSPPPPPLDHAACLNCSHHMELLVQIWCPIENSPNDRALFVWACANPPCQRKPGSVRAWRELRYNKKYAQKLQKNLARQKLEQPKEPNAPTELAANKPHPKSNPFALGATAAQGPFGLGSQLFGNPQSPSCVQVQAPSVAPPAQTETEVADPDAAQAPSSPEDGSDPESSDDDDADALAAAVASASLTDSPWAASAAYSPLYLSTVAEYLPSPPKVKVPAGAMVDPAGGDDDTGKKKKDKDGHDSWAMEGYENSMDVDHAFERFSKRVACEGEQCLRYDLGGTPLPFSSDKVFDMLFPVPPAPPMVAVTKGEFMVSTARKRGYAPEALPACAHCQSRRVFECQLMPNLINVLKPDEHQDQEERKRVSDQERHAEVLRALQRGRDGGGVRGMEWGTCMVFSCEKDCTSDAGAAGMWREEHVLVQWDE